MSNKACVEEKDAQDRHDTIQALYIIATLLLRDRRVWHRGYLTTCRERERWAKGGELPRDGDTRVTQLRIPQGGEYLLL
jgi:hypothetical protein